MNTGLFKSKLFYLKLSLYILKIFEYVFIITAVFIFTLIFIAQINGLKLYHIKTASMHPQIRKNSMIFVKKTDFDNLKKGDVITFSQQNAVVAHRIYDINYAGKNVITKGDNIGKPDEKPVSADSIIGKVLFSVPLIGGLAGVFSSLFKLIIFLLIIAVFIIIYIILNEFLKNQISKSQKPKEQT